MRFRRNSFNQLFIKCDPAPGSGHFDQDAVIIAPAPAQPVSSRIKAYTRNQHQVQTVQRE
jgi:hypothetical protein